MSRFGYFGEALKFRCVASHCGQNHKFHSPRSFSSSAQGSCCAAHWPPVARLPSVGASDAGVLSLDAVYEIMLRLPAVPLSTLRSSHSARHHGPRTYHLAIRTFDPRLCRVALILLLTVASLHIDVTRSLAS